MWPLCWASHATREDLACAVLPTTLWTKNWHGGRGSVSAWTKSWHREKGSVYSVLPLTFEKKPAGIRCSGWVEASSGDSWQFQDVPQAVSQPGSQSSFFHARAQHWDWVSEGPRVSEQGLHTSEL